MGVSSSRSASESGSHHSEDSDAESIPQVENGHPGTAASASNQSVEAVTVAFDQDFDWIDLASKCKDLIRSDFLLEVCQRSNFSFDQFQSEIYPAPEILAAHNENRSIDNRDLADVYLSSEYNEPSGEDINSIVRATIAEEQIMIDVNSNRIWKMREFIVKGFLHALSKRVVKFGVRELFNQDDAKTFFSWTHSVDKKQKQSAENNDSKLQPLYLLVATSIAMSSAGIVGLSGPSRVSAMNYMCSSLICIFCSIINESNTSRSVNPVKLLNQ